MADESTTGKRSRASENSPSNKEKKKSKSSHTVLCCICDVDIVDDTDESVLCEGICQAWMHRKCAGISRQVFAVISKSNDPYLCSHCMLSNYKEEIVSLKNQVSSLSNELALLKVNQVPTDVSDSSLPDNSQVSNMNTNSLEPHSGFDAVKSFIAEEKEKTRRRLNLIMHHVPESTASEGLARKQDDINQVSSVLDKYIGITPNIQKAFRVGSKGDTPRLLKIMIPTEHDKAFILRNSFKLRSDDNPEEIKKIFITPDLTPKEQKENKKLRAELKEKNKDGNFFRIKNGKITRR